jgi:hypothetical protein
MCSGGVGPGKLVVMVVRRYGGGVIPAWAPIPHDGRGGTGSESSPLWKEHPGRARRSCSKPVGAERRGVVWTERGSGGSLLKPRNVTRTPSYAPSNDAEIRGTTTTLGIITTHIDIGDTVTLYYCPRVRVIFL